MIPAMWETYHLSRITYRAISKDEIRTFRWGSGQQRRWPCRAWAEIQGFRRLHRRSRGPRLSQHLPGRASLHRMEPDFGHAESADLGSREDKDAAGRDSGNGAALAQPRAACRAGGDARSALRGAPGFRRRQGLPLQRVQRLLRSDGGSRPGVSLTTAGTGNSRTLS
jgi:hypothetical protein